jgi:hypothetical protein
MTNARLLLARLAPPALLLCLAAGCTGNRASVSGQVTGWNPGKSRIQPVMAGRIRFFCPGQVFSADIFQGQYQIADLPAGEASVTVESSESSTPKASKDAPGWFPIPEKFRRVESTPLKCKIVPGEQILNVSLHSGRVESR